jgi:hypothetical protein
MRYSGLQREVLALYRKCLRESRKKEVVSQGEVYLNSFLTRVECEDSFRIFRKVSEYKSLPHREDLASFR